MEIMPQQLKIIISALTAGLVLCAVAFAAGDPLSFLKLKPGAWSVTATGKISPSPSSYGHKPSHSLICLDEDTPSPPAQFLSLASGIGCAYSSVVHEGDVYALDMTCGDNRGYVQTNHFKCIIRNEDEIQVVNQTTTQNRTLTGTELYEYEGPCPSNMKPGDVEMSDGTVVNTGSLMKRVPPI